MHGTNESPIGKSQTPSRHSHTHPAGGTNISGTKLHDANHAKRGSDTGTDHGEPDERVVQAMIVLSPHHQDPAPIDGYIDARYYPCRLRQSALVTDAARCAIVMSRKVHDSGVISEAGLPTRVVGHRVGKLFRLDHDDHPKMTTVNLRGLPRLGLSQGHPDRAVEIGWKSGKVVE